MTNLNSATEPLLALDRWTLYTQSELQSLRWDTIQQREEDKSVHRIQQMQLESIRGQMRDISQQCTEPTDAVAELYNHVREIRNALDRIVHDLGSHFDSIRINSLPPTQLVSSQDAL